MIEEKGRRRKEKNDSEGRSGKGRNGTRKGRRYALELKPPKTKNAGYTSIGVEDGGQGALASPKFGKIYFSGKNDVNSGILLIFFGHISCNIREFCC